MKKQSPMQMTKKAAKSDPRPTLDKKPGRKLSAMERYAQERNAQLQAQKIPSLTVEMHDPEHDLSLLSRAKEVQRNPSRHRAAKEVGKKKIRALTELVK